MWCDILVFGAGMHVYSLSVNELKVDACYNQNIFWKENAFWKIGLSFYKFPATSKWLDLTTRRGGLSQRECTELMIGLTSLLRVSNIFFRTALFLVAQQS